MSDPLVDAPMSATHSVWSQSQLSAVRQGLFFIVGHHRGGTTLLQAMLTSHPALTIPPETGFFQQVWPRRAMWGPPTNPAARARAWTWLTSSDCAVSDLKLAWNELAPVWLEGRLEFDELFVLLLAAYADSRGKFRVGEKSPGHIHCVDELARLFPSARFICLLRDPRAVVRSELETTWGSRSVQRIMRRWNRVVDQHERLLLRPELTGRYVWLKYEDLVLHPEAELQRLCDFLGEAFDPAMLSFNNRSADEYGFTPDETWKLNTLQPVQPQRSDLWREQLSDSMIWLCESLAGERLQHLGYETVATGPTWQDRKFQLADLGRHGWELARDVFRGRRRRRPWRAVWNEFWHRWGQSG